MTTKLREMTWDMVLLFATPFAMGLIMMIIVAIHRDNPKVGDHILMFAIGVALTVAGIVLFTLYLFEKGVGQYQNPDTFQQQEDHELTATH